MENLDYAKYHYFGDCGKAYTNVIIFATVKEDNFIKFSFSCSSKKDLYDKKIGRIKAFNRLNSAGYAFYVPISETLNRYKDIHKYLGEFVLKNTHIFPSWAESVVLSRLVNYVD